VYKKTIQSEPKGQAWSEELKKLGYELPLPAPIPAVQTTLAAIDMPEFHCCVQELDTAAINDVDEEGGHAPLLLDTLDLAAWTSLFVLATADRPKTVERIRCAQNKLSDLLIEDETEAVRSAHLAQKIESILKLANEDALTVDTARTVLGPEQLTTTDTHPLLAKMNISEADKSALEDFSEGIQSSQAEKHRNTMVASKGPVVPLKPPRSVELLVTDFQHRMWAIGNTNLMAPISIPMWKAWTGFSDQEVECCKKQALNNIGVLRAPMDLMHAFPLNMFDHSKCTTLEVKLHTKQDLPTGHNRKDSHLSEMWNVQRPYMRCLCNPRATSGCKGSIIWFDHAIWTMVNKLDTFFPNYPTSVARFAAFMIWMRESARVAVKAAIMFHTGREQMMKAAIQLSENPNQILLTEIHDSPIASKIERLLKGPKFSLAHPGSPSKAPSPFKRQRLNLNSSPSDRMSQGGRGRGSPGGRGVGTSRGGRGFRGRGGGRAATRNPTPNTQSPGRVFSLWGSQASLVGGESTPGPEASMTAVTPTGGSNGSQSPLKGRVLLWEEDI
jgi:hypothetical protein